MLPALYVFNRMLAAVPFDTYLQNINQCRSTDENLSYVGGPLR